MLVMGLHLIAALSDDGMMENHRPLALRLDHCRNLPGAWVASYDRMIARIRQSGATDAAPRRTSPAGTRQVVAVRPPEHQR